MKKSPADGKCERCRSKTSITRMSIFNTDMCCIECIEIEKKHPEYKRAVKIELQALVTGDYNFPGIGLPNDLLHR